MLVISNVITGIIVVINIILKELTVILIVAIGYDTHSEQLSKITNSVFIGQFFNTGFLLLLVYANFESQSFPLSDKFHGPFNDYTDKWYALVGAQIVKTMLTNAVLPPVVEAVPIIKAWFFQRLD